MGEVAFRDFGSHRAPKIVRSLKFEKKFKKRTLKTKFSKVWKILTVICRKNSFLKFTPLWASY